MVVVDLLAGRLLSAVASRFARQPLKLDVDEKDERPPQHKKGPEKLQRYAPTKGNKENKEREKREKERRREKKERIREKRWEKRKRKREK